MIDVGDGAIVPLPLTQKDRDDPRVRRHHARTAPDPLSADGGAAPPDGETLFLAKNCQLCHSVGSAGIKATDPKAKIVELSGLSARRKADWLKAYLEKKEKLDGQVHPPKFRGAPGDLGWLMALTPAP